MASFSVVTNIASANAQANLGFDQHRVCQSALTRLSSGFRINNSGDDAAGLAVANGYRDDGRRCSTRASATPTTVCRPCRSRTARSTTSRTLLDRLATLATQAASGARRPSTAPR